jgi:lipopolysaccharide heptosyltransferase I
MPRPPLAELNPERIAIIKPSALGDIVHALPVLTALRRRFPAAHITWIVNRSYEPLLEGHPDLDATLTFDRGAMKRGVVSTAMTAVRFANTLRSGKFDLAIDLQGLFRSGLMTFATGAARRVGLSTAREGASHFYTDVVPTPGLDEAHAVDRCWRAAEAFSASDQPKSFHIPIAADARRWVDEQLAGCERPWLVFAVGARWLTKRWPPEHFAAIARAAQDRAGGTAIFIGTSDETILADDTIRSLAGPAVNLSGQTNLQQLVAVLAAADFVAANDSGPLHIAAALGRPLVAPYTCTEIRMHGPYGARGAVATTVACHGSYIRTCDHLSCMAELTPDRLLAPLAEALAAWPSLCRSA